MSSMLRRQQRRDFVKRGYTRPFKMVEGKGKVLLPWPQHFPIDTLKNREQEEA